MPAAHPPPLLGIGDLAVALPEGGDRALAVDGVSLTLARGEALCLVGESGSGKSVTASAVMGLLPQGRLVRERGSIRLAGEELTTASRARLKALRGSAMAMIFQEPMTALNPLMTLGKQVAEVLQIHGVASRSERRARVLELFERVRLPEPDRLMRAYPHQVSGGQRQRVGIAMAIACEPALLIADEPTTALDVTTQAAILALIDELRRERGMGVLFITHDFGVVAEIADRVAVLQYGRLVEEGPVAKVLRQPATDYTRQLLAAVPRLRPRPRRSFDPAPVLKAEGIDKTFRTRRLWQADRTVVACRDVSLSLRRGEALGVVGESGSGKSTLARCLMRLIPPDAGRILVGGEPFDERSGKDLRRRCQIVFQDPYGSLDPRRTVGWSIAEGLLIRGTGRREAAAAAERVLTEVGLSATALARYPHQFSGGQRQRISIARALVLDPDVLIADEPVSALDVTVQAQVLALLELLRRNRGLSMVFITHDLRVAAQVCDRIAVMQHGEVVEEAPTDEIFATPRNAYTRALLAAIPGRSLDAAVPEPPLQSAI